MVDSAISALLANLQLAGNPALLAETLSSLAVAAQQAQVCDANHMHIPAEFLFAGLVVGGASLLA